MNLETRVSNDVLLVRVTGQRLVFPEVESFASIVKSQLNAGPRHVVLDLSDVTYLDSPAHGYLFDLYRVVAERGGTMKLIGVQPRVEAMARLVGLTRFVEVLRG